MATTRMTLAQAKATRPTIDLVRIEATTEADIGRHMAEDGELAGSFAGEPRLVLPAGAVRKNLGMSQQRFAALIGVPLGTVRNWEQGRVLPYPAARALLTILAREPAAALRALRLDTADS